MEAHPEPVKGHPGAIEAQPEAMEAHLGAFSLTLEPCLFTLALFRLLRS